MIEGCWCNRCEAQRVNNQRGEEMKDRFYFSKVDDPNKWPVSWSLWPAWFWVPVLRFFGVKVLDLRGKK